MHTQLLSQSPSSRGEGENKMKKLVGQDKNSNWERLDPAVVIS